MKGKIQGFFPLDILVVMTLNVCSNIKEKKLINKIWKQFKNLIAMLHSFGYGTYRIGI